MREPLPPHLDAMKALWEKRRGNRLMPLRRDFIAEDFFPWFGHIRIVRVEREPIRFKVTLSGTQVVEYDGTDFTGRYLDEAIPPKLLARVNAVYMACIETRRPVFDTQPGGSLKATTRGVSRLLLPCGGENVDTVIAAIYASGFDKRLGTIHDPVDRVPA